MIFIILISILCSTSVYANRDVTGVWDYNSEYSFMNNSGTKLCIPDSPGLTDFMHKDFMKIISNSNLNNCIKEGEDHTKICACIESKGGLSFPRAIFSAERLKQIGMSLKMIQLGRHLSDSVDSVAIIEKVTAILDKDGIAHDTCNIDNIINNCSPKAIKRVNKIFKVNTQLGGAIFTGADLGEYYKLAGTKIQANSHSLSLPYDDLISDILTKEEVNKSIVSKDSGFALHNMFKQKLSASIKLFLKRSLTFSGPTSYDQVQDLVTLLQGSPVTTDSDLENCLRGETIDIKRCANDFMGFLQLNDRSVASIDNLNIDDIAIPLFEKSGRDKLRKSCEEQRNNLHDLCTKAEILHPEVPFSDLDLESVLSNLVVKGEVEFPKINDLKAQKQLLKCIKLSKNFEQLKSLLTFSEGDLDSFVPAESKDIEEVVGVNGIYFPESRVPFTQNPSLREAVMSKSIIANKSASITPMSSTSLSSEESRSSSEFDSAIASMGNQTPQSVSSSFSPSELSSAGNKIASDISSMESGLEEKQEKVDALEDRVQRSTSGEDKISSEEESSLQAMIEKLKVEMAELKDEISSAKKSQDVVAKATAIQAKTEPNSYRSKDNLYQPTVASVSNSSVSAPSSNTSGFSAAEVSAPSGGGSNSVSGNTIQRQASRQYVSSAFGGSYLGTGGLLTFSIKETVKMLLPENRQELLKLLATQGEVIIQKENGDYETVSAIRKNGEVTGYVIVANKKEKLEQSIKKQEAKKLTKTVESPVDSQNIFYDDLKEIQ